MSEIKAFLRSCPSCGQRFHVRLVGEKLVGTAAGVATIEPAGGSRGGRTEAEASSSTQLIVEEDECQYSYKCKHCGHEWSEVHMIESKGTKPRNYTGD
jgi:hypothetical protein